MNGRMILVTGLCVFLGACAQLGKITGGKDKKPAADGPKPMTGLDAYRAAGGRVSGGGGGFGTTAGMARATVGPASGITPDSEIQWAPEDPNQPIPGEELWKKPENKSWYVSHTEALRYSRQSGKPVMVWFTDSARSPICRRLSQELFSRKEFDEWAGENLIRLRVDHNVGGRSELRDLETRKLKYIEKLKRRYNVHGHPTVIMLSPRGSVIQSYRGYQKGNADFYWGRIRQAVVISDTEYGKWREKLEKRGYRMWESRDGRKTLAKLYRFRPGKVTLIDPDGNRASTKFSKLCDADQAWIMLQKKRYEARRGR